jgi:hypothetical protein
LDAHVAFRLVRSSIEGYIFLRGAPSDAHTVAHYLPPGFAVWGADGCHYDDSYTLIGEHPLHDIRRKLFP